MLSSVTANRFTSGSSERREGLALLVVMIVFVVLFLVVYHLEYWTTMEAHVSKIRQTDAQAHDAMYSVGLFVAALLTEDYVQDLQENQSATGAGGAGGAGALGDIPGMGELPGLDGAGGNPRAGAGGTPGAGGAGGNFVPIAGGAGGGTTVAHFDYIRENVFNEVRQDVGDVQVKALIIDNERRFDLNLLFGYAKLVLGSRAGADGGLAGEEAAGEPNANEAAAEEDQRSLRGRSGRGGQAGGAGARAGRAARGGDDSGEPAEADELSEQLGMQEDIELTEFVEPTPEVIQATEEMLQRAIEAVISMNEDWGYEYHETIDSTIVAQGIVEYVLARRNINNTQNIIYHSSELLNIPTISPELYFGPAVPITDSESYPVEVEGQWEGFLDLFEVRRDEFGDYVAKAIIDDPEYAQILEEQQLRLEELQETWGAFAEFPGAGLGRLAGSSLTRGMEEPAVVYDEEGNGYVPQEPLPLGLKDIFCTFSTGKINLNTAAFPVVYGLLLSLDPDPGNDASNTAMAVVDYRNRLQDFSEEEDDGSNIDRVETTPDRGQPKRERPVEEDELALSDEELGFEEAGSAYADLETNYFTNLEQLELIDGSDGGPEDVLRSDVGVERVNAEDGSVLQRALNDLRPVTVFGSTYFTIELKARIKATPLVKKGYLIVKRDPETRMMEVILWKEYQ